MKDNLMIIKFDDNAEEMQRSVMRFLIGVTVICKFTDNSLPTDCAIWNTHEEGIVICEVDETGRPLGNSRYHVGYDEIISITVI